MTEPRQDQDALAADDQITPEQIRDAMAVYSADGQVDDETGGNAAAEQLRAHPDESAEGEPIMNPEAGHIGPV